MNPKVSVIIPVYNAEQYISECLESVFQQTFQEIEIICIDDCSTDNSVKIIKQASIHDFRITLVRNEKNLGVGETRNRGIMLAKGKYFFFLDADDFLVSDAIEKLYFHSESHALQLCFCSHVNYNEIDKSIRKGSKTTDIFLKRYQDSVFSWNDVQRFLYQNIFCVPWNRLYQTDFIRDSSIRFPNLKNSEDLFFGEAIVTIAERMGVISYEFPLVYYRLGRKGQISSTIPQNPYCMLDSVKLLYDFLKNNHKLQGMERSYHSMALDMLLFPIKTVEHPGQLIKHTVEMGFPKIGMDQLGCNDFSDAVSYKKYCELLTGNNPHFDAYMVSVKEDYKKKDEIRNFLKQHKDKKIALWGMGKRGQTLIHELGNTDDGFDYYIDADPIMASKAMEGKKIYRYDEITEQLDYIIVTNKNLYGEIYMQCKRMSLFCKIIDLDTYFQCDMTLEECMA